MLEMPDLHLPQTPVHQQRFAEKARSTGKALLTSHACLQVREIYETAIEAEEAYQLSDEDTKTLCLR